MRGRHLIGWPRQAGGAIIWVFIIGLITTSFSTHKKDAGIELGLAKYCIHLGTPRTQNLIEPIAALLTAKDKSIIVYVMYVSL